jgi:hypothetical protein
MKKESWFYAAALLSGTFVWIALSVTTGRKEAWDSPLYFSVGIPIVCAVSMVLAFFSPARSWRWGITPTAGQFLWMLVSQGPGNLLPLGIVAFGVLSVPSIITASIGCYFGRKRAAASES